MHSKLFYREWLVNTVINKTDMQVIENQTFDEERALYGLRNTVVSSCVFDGPADGESALKESHNIELNQCDLRLRYPLWHVVNGVIKHCSMPETCRAALWYDKNLNIETCTLHGIKALRECQDVGINSCEIKSSEFAWRCRDIEIRNSSLVSEYPFFECKNVKVDNLTMNAKYSFQYVENIEVRNSRFKTKDAFWHAKDVTVYDSVLEGEYLAWYSENLRLVRCHIKGTQPFCYCKGLILEDCTMEDCDLSFERSEVQAKVCSHIDSVKNPLSGRIEANSIGKIIFEDNVADPSKSEIIASNDIASCCDLNTCSSPAA